MIVSACAKDETADVTAEQDSLPEESPPVAAPEWYPTPKRTGPVGYRVLPPATSAGDPFAQYPQEPAPPPAAGTGYETKEIQWPSDLESKEYRPWTTGKTPAPGTPQPAPPGTRRPWGAIDGTVQAPPAQPPQNVWQFQGAQPAWGTGYQLPPGQPYYAPGTYGTYPQAYPGTVR